MQVHRTKILGFSLLLGGLVLCGIGLWLLLSPAQYRAEVKIIIMSDVSDIEVYQKITLEQLGMIHISFKSHLRSSDRRRYLAM